MKRMHICLVILALFCASCASDRHARQTAADLSQAVLRYEGEINAKAGAENKFYQEQLATLRKVLGGNDAITQSTAEVVPENLAERPLPYLRVVSESNRDARVTAEGLMTSSSGSSMAGIIDFVEKGVSSEREHYISYLERQRELMTTLGEGLQPIVQQKAKVTEVRNGLEELIKPRSNLKKAEEYARFAKEVYDLSKPK